MLKMVESGRGKHREERHHANTDTDGEIVIHSRKDTMGGTPVFKGTRVVVKNLFDYLASGYSLDVFLDDFPSVSREQAVRALEMAKESLESHAYESVRA